jgi:hypothetical protein
MIMDLFINALQFVAVSLILVGVTAVFISSVLDREDKK